MCIQNLPPGPLSNKDTLDSFLCPLCSILLNDVTRLSCSTGCLLYIKIPSCDLRCTRTIRSEHLCWKGMVSVSQQLLSSRRTVSCKYCIFHWLPSVVLIYAYVCVYISLVNSGGHGDLHSKIWSSLGKTKIKIKIVLWAFKFKYSM